MRDLIQSHELAFAAIDQRSRTLLALLTDEQLYQRPRQIAQTLTPFSCGEYILRSAAAVEQTFNGLTRRLWDDPFEWTLPEKLATIDSVATYLDEVVSAAASGLKFFAVDEDLTKMVETPGGTTPINCLLLDTAIRSSHLQGRAFAIFQVLSDHRLPRL